MDALDQARCRYRCVVAVAIPFGLVWVVSFFGYLKGPTDSSKQVFLCSGSIGIVSFPQHRDGAVAEEYGESVAWNEFRVGAPTFIPRFDRPSADPRHAGWYYASVPLWPALIVAGWQVVLARRTMVRVSQSFCGRCTYSRVGLADSTPCPECGVPRAFIDSGT